MLKPTRNQSTSVRRPRRKGKASTSWTGRGISQSPGGTGHRAKLTWDAAQSRPHSQREMPLTWSTWERQEGGWDPKGSLRVWFPCPWRGQPAEGEGEPNSGLKDNASRARLSQTHSAGNPESFSDQKEQVYDELCREKWRAGRHLPGVWVALSGLRKGGAVAGSCSWSLPALLQHCGVFSEQHKRSSWGFSVKVSGNLRGEKVPHFIWDGAFSPPLWNLAQD